MKLTKLFFLVFLVQLFYVIPKTSAQLFEFLYNLCGDNHSTPNAYLTNLKTTLNSMSSNTQITYGYYNFTAGQQPNKVEAMALCRADISVDDCRDCVSSSASSLLSVCPNSMKAFGYSDNCVIYYTNISLFHVLTDRPFWALRFDGRITADIPKFNSSLTTLMTSLQNKASLGNSVLKFATGNTKVTANQSLYGLVQCSPDLNRLDCVKCVQNLTLSVFTQYFITTSPLYMAKGGRVVSASCNLRYELYPFYKNVTYIATPPASNRNATTSIQGASSSKSHKIIAIVVPIVGSLVLILIIASFCIFVRRKKQIKFSGNFDKEEMDTLQSLQFSTGAIKVATENFAVENVLGKGGSATVYKGKLTDGQEIAVKRIERHAVLGEEQFKNEILTLAKLHHGNLVRLLGFCLEEDEMLLIYEFVVNKSLDAFLFDPEHRASMHWDTRLDIINGVARGLLYLHEDSQQRIIHRDLKAANVLLDADFIPKIADFGLAKLFKADQSQAVASKVVGTHGYMPPEYLIQGQVSLKSDVFSFGVLVLEIVSGQKISSFQIGEKQESLLAYAWENWQEGKAWNLVDPALSPAFSAEILRCIHIGLLCVQNNMADRPTMSSVSLMLSSNTMTLEAPLQPAFFKQNRPMLLSEPSQDNSSDQSNSRSLSVNEASVTELYPR
ncbi:putative receptor-like protein kinase At4g00960 [Chenopodium quinoa]|uniref:Cysteine-rich receptor-like protein kinase 10 n=1 Tax=Chenopodium quinoa TaxID=63459 RepID=A0A803LKU7_CHEQI|nr:putative receptor-like protein kinase At4g00960 [Chenopodium quinoa]